MSLYSLNAIKTLFVKMWVVIDHKYCVTKCTFAKNSENNQKL